MATVGAAGFVIKDAVLTLNGNTYDGVDAVTFTPTSAVQTWKGISGKILQDAGATTWSCSISGLQDWENPQSLSNYFLSSESTAVTGNVKPKGTGTVSFDFTVLITPGQIGGAVDQFAPFSVDFNLIGKPVKKP